jgi:adenine-specific DNA-methyltransferase
MIKYLGSKRSLIPHILACLDQLEPITSAIDLFSGTSRVGHAFKRRGHQVFSNDINAYAFTLAKCYVQADREAVGADAQSLIDELNRLPGKAGYITHEYCEQARYFQPQNGERIDAIRERIASLSLEPELEAVLLTSLIEAADRVDSTTGLQMAYLKSWSARSFNPLELRLPELLPAATNGPCRAFQLDALEAAQTLSADLAYLDPPYNQHSYLGNYHIWESIITWDKPETYGVARKRVDVRERQSDFNSRRKFLDAFSAVVAAVQAPNLIVSFSDEGFLAKSKLLECLAPKGEVQVLEVDYKRYVGAQIGIYNPAGDKVGEVGNLRNKELLFVVTPKPLPGSSLGTLESAKPL